TPPGCSGRRSFTGGNVPALVKAASIGASLNSVGSASARPARGSVARVNVRAVKRLTACRRPIGIPALFILAAPVFNALVVFLGWFFWSLLELSLGRSIQG